MGTKWLGKKTNWVVFTINVIQPDHACSHSFPYPVIGNIIVIILYGPR